MSDEQPTHTTTEGTRVGALLSMDRRARVVWLLGYGTFGGYHPVPSSVLANTAAGERVRELQALGLDEEAKRAALAPFPRLDLDSGEQVYGVECWWGTEDYVREVVAEKAMEGWFVAPACISRERPDGKRAH
jgi:hypothetical protein